MPTQDRLRKRKRKRKGKGKRKPLPSVFDPVSQASLVRAERQIRLAKRGRQQVRIGLHGLHRLVHECLAWREERRLRLSPVEWEP